MSRSHSVRVATATLTLVACSAQPPAERYGFIARLGRDTISVESVSRAGNRVTSDEVDRFPRVRQRHTEITLDSAGGIARLMMDITTPSEPQKQRERHVVADVTRDSIIMTKSDGGGAIRWSFPRGGQTVMAHIPQMYSLYELYFGAALRRIEARGPSGSDTARLRQFYIDREFDRFSIHHGVVRRRPGGKAQIAHDWLAGIGEATLDSAHRLLRYDGSATTYLVDVTRLDAPPDVRAIGARFAASEAQAGGAKALSVRDTLRAAIGAAAFTVDYGRPLARGRDLLGNVIPYDLVWRTGANAATQFTTSTPIVIGALRVPAGTYTLWTRPRRDGVDLIVNTQTGQWGTSYDRSRDLGLVPMTSEKPATPVEQFTISIAPVDSLHGTLAMAWGSFRWTAPIAIR